MPPLRTCFLRGLLAISFAVIVTPRAGAEERPAAERTARRSPPTASPSDDSAIPLSAPKSDSPLPLARPGGKKSGRSGGGLPAVGTALGSLAVVLALFFGVAWMLKRGMPRGSNMLPKDVVELLGRAPLPGRQQMHLIRCGSKLLLVWATPHGVETLTEITDPVEVDRLTAACRQPQPSSAAAAFQQVFQQISREPAQGFLEPGHVSGRPRAASTTAAGGGDHA